jgi:transcription factor SPT20
MKVIIEHIRAGTVPHDMMEELLRAGVQFYEGNIGSLVQFYQGQH